MQGDDESVEGVPLWVLIADGVTVPSGSSRPFSF